MKLVLRSVRPPVVVVGIATTGVLLSLVLFLMLRSWERREQQDAASSLVRDKVGTLRVSLLRSMEVLHSLAALHAADERISRIQFEKFVDAALRRQPELLALSWNPVVAAGQRSNVEAEARANGDPGFEFRELNAAGELVPAGERAEYVPVRFIEPRNRNAAALGYDLNSDPSRRGSVETARDSGQPVATAPIRLAQEKSDQSGFLVVLPVFSQAAPSTLEERRKTITGFAVAVFRVTDLVSAAFQSLADRGIRIWLRDETPGLQSMGFMPGSAGGAPPAEADRLVNLEIAGRRLAVHYAPDARFVVGQGPAQSWLILVGGLFLTLVTTAYVHSNARRSSDVAAANDALREEVSVRQQAEAAAAAANKAKSDFLASMSHEIRTPLNAILGYTQLMQRDTGLSPDQRDSVRGISVSGQHLLGLINEILDLSKIEAGRMELNETDFDLPALASSLETTFKPLCAQQRIGFRVIVSAGQSSARVRGDEGKLRQVLINLVGNAIKFTSAGEVVLQCQSGESSRWRFDVTDTGQGIPPEEQADIFNPFHQGSGSKHHGGTGLGLTIARRQVQLLGGDLQLESERGRGSRFFFSIPLKEAPVDSRANQRVPVRLAQGCHVRALVVDDRWENRDVLGRMLSAIGCDVAYACSASEATLRAREFQPTIAFIDWLMPDVPGRTLVEWLSGDPLYGQPKLIAHTASPLSRHRDEALIAGCVGFLAKPFRSEQLQDFLSRHLGVTYEYADATADRTPMGELPAGLHITLPEDLHARLMVAAELHSTTALKSCLSQLRLLGATEELLANHIRHLMRSYDMDGIQRLLAGTVTSGRPAPAVHAHGAHRDC